MWKVFNGLFSKIEVKQDSTEGCHIVLADNAPMNAQFPFDEITEIRHMHRQMHICIGNGNKVIVPWNNYFYQYLQRGRYRKLVKNN